MISVIIPLYNKEGSIAHTIQSVLDQHGADFEIVVVDDGSSDHSCTVVEAIHDQRIRLFHQPNGGPSIARNTGIDNARGDWVFFLDADDKLLPNAFQSFVAIQEQYPNVNCFAFDFFVSRNGEEKRFYNKQGVTLITNPLKSWCTRTLFPRTGASFMRLKVVQDCHFVDKLRRYEDAEWLFRIMRDEVFVRSGEPVMVYCTSESEASKRRKDIDEDFMGHLDFKGKNIWEQVALYQLLKDAYLSYPEEATALYMDLGITNTRLLSIKALTYYCTMVNRKNALLKRIK